MQKKSQVNVSKKKEKIIKKRCSSKLNLVEPLKQASIGRGEELDDKEMQKEAIVQCSLETYPTMNQKSKRIEKKVVLYKSKKL